MDIVLNQFNSFVLYMQLLLKLKRENGVILVKTNFVSFAIIFWVCDNGCWCSNTFHHKYKIFITKISCTSYSVPT